MRTEEANRLKDRIKELSLNSSKANLVESSGTVVKDRSKGKQKKGSCFVCGKVGHRVAKCYQRKGQGSKHEGQSDVQAHFTEGNEVIDVVVVEANLVANKIDWVLDTGASMHFCVNKELFHDFEESSDGECVYMDSTTAVVMSKGKVLLELTSENIFP
ncbi:hypothetical protein KY285_030698 [Solanum tuberosum]|nr:hypothetical protein KY285_030698 [Solanum tuberosum]